MYFFSNDLTEETAQESIPSPPPMSTTNVPRMIRRPSNEELPSICIHEPTSDHNDSNIVPDGYFEMKKKETHEDSDDSDDSKMVFRISEKKSDTANLAANIPVPLLPPPPSPSLSKKSKESDGNRSGSSSPTDDEAELDPLAIFRNKSEQSPVKGKNLISDWDESSATNEYEQERVGKLSVSVDVVCLVLVTMLSSRFV